MKHFFPPSPARPEAEVIQRQILPYEMPLLQNSPTRFNEHLAESGGIN